MYSKQQLHNFRRHFFKENNVRPFVRASKEGSTHIFMTIHECAAHFNVDPETVWDAFITGGDVQDYVITNVGHQDREAVEYKLKNHISREKGETANKLAPRPVKVMDITDGRMASFPSVSRAARRLRVSIPNIRHRISTKDKCSLIAGQFIVLDEATDHGFITPELKEKLLRRIPRQIVQFNQKEGTLKRFTGLAAFTRAEECEENIVHIYYTLKTREIYLYMPGVYIMFDPKRGGQTSDNEMFGYFRAKLNRVSQMF